MNDYAIQKLEKDAATVLGESMHKFICDRVDDDSCLSELRGYVDDAMRKGYRLDINKAKVVFDILKLRNEEEIGEILSYMEHSDCGWQGVE